MLKKTIKYTDYNGAEREEDFYFNLTKAELAEMELEVAGGLEQKIRKVVASQDNREIIKIFKDIVLRSYGVKSDDGRRFIKNDEIRADFAQTEAYSILFMELATNDEVAAAFINAVIPNDIQPAKQKALP